MNQGRTASYPTAPSQIPACGITAPGSSNLLTYALTIRYSPQWGLHGSSSLSYPGHVSFTSYTDPSFPSPCGRLSRLRVLWDDLTPSRPSDSLPFVEKPYLIKQETQGSPKFSTLLFLRAMLSDPDRPSRISPSCRSLRIGFRLLKIVATCLCDNGAELLQEGANPLTAHRIPCVRFVWVVWRYVYPS